MVACGDQQRLIQVWCPRTDWKLAFGGASEGGAEGWYSRYYMGKERGSELVGSFQANSGVFATWVGKGEAIIRMGVANTLDLEVGGNRRRLTGHFPLG